MAIVHVIKPSILLFLFLIISPLIDAAPDSDALLKFKSSIVNAEALHSWQQGAQPCDRKNRWGGVICHKGVVYGIQLEKMNLSGTIDIDALVQLPELRSISFMSNSFSGPIPGFNKLGALKNLYLSGNQFSGEIPSNYFDSMDSLKKVWLSENTFTGEIPSSLAKIQTLIELQLENNQFSGKIPEFSQKSLVSLDLSNNNLTGEIPSGLSRFNATIFAGNAGLCGKKIDKPCEEPKENKDDHPEGKKDDNPKENKDDNPKGDNNGGSSNAIWISIVCAVIVLLMIAGVFLLRRKRKNFQVLEKEVVAEVPKPVPSKKDTGSRRNTRSTSRRAKATNERGGIRDLVIVNDEKGEFGLSDLMKAAAEVLGNGAVGSSYKAMMSSGLTVVVKRVKEMNKVGQDEFDIEIRRIAKLKHKNILPPLAYNFRKDEKLLVSEYMPKGSLLYLLHGDRGLAHAELKWPTRLNIIQGIARGLGYLRTELAHLDLPHGDLKSSNVLLSPEYEPLLADYGYSSLINSNHVTQALFAYKSPEAVQNNQVSPKSDVYCLGVIILEILTGKFPSQYLANGKGGTDIVQWVRSAIADGREADLFDPDIVSSNNAQMEQLLHIGAACTEPDPEQRLDIGESIRRIEEIHVEGGQAVKQIEVLPSLRDGLC